MFFGPLLATVRDARGRALVAAGWLGLQAVLIASGGRRPEGAFAFRMFSESSTLAFTLSRDVVSEVGRGSRRLRVEDGTWVARDRQGTLHRFRWDDRVTDRNLFPYERPVHASYGAAAQIDRLGHALDDVAAHLDGDNDTLRLVADVTVRRNGGPPERVHLESSWRD